MRQFSCERLVREMRQECTTFPALSCVTVVCGGTSAACGAVYPVKKYDKIPTQIYVKAVGTAKIKEVNTPRQTCVRNTAKPLCTWGVTRLSKHKGGAKAQERRGVDAAWACSAQAGHAPGPCG